MATFVGIGVSEKKDPFLAGCEAAKMALHHLRHKPISLGFLFSTIHFADRRLLEGVMHTLGKIPIIGSSGAALISSEGIHTYGAGLMLLGCDKIKFGLAHATDINAKGARAAGEEFAHLALKNLGSMQKDTALIFADGLVENASDLLRGIKDVLGTSFPIVGGSSADNFRFFKTYQYCQTEVYSNSVTGAVFSGEKIFGIGLRHGWKPLGRPHVITKVKGNVIKSIENRPAVSIYEEYFGKSRGEIKHDLLRISIYYPLGLYVPGETEYLLRNALRVDEDGGLVCQGDAFEGSDVRLMMGTKEWALEAATQAAKEAKESLTDKTPKGALIFESVSRHKLLGRLTEKELSRIKEVLGDIPLLGIVTYGEQAPLKSVEHSGETYFHNETVALLTLGESYGPH
ncbi:MAG: FIST N-terminal domain-containing protein [Candidatus Omnitrophota bacterium]